MIYAFSNGCKTMMNTHYLYSINETSHTSKAVHTCKPSNKEASLGFRAKKESIQDFIATTWAAQTTTASMQFRWTFAHFPSLVHSATKSQHHCSFLRFELV